MKIRKLAALVLALTLSGSIFTVNTRTKAKDKNQLDTVILLNDNSANEEIKDIVEENGGEVLSELNQIGEIHIKADSNLILKLKGAESVKSVTTNLKLKLKSEEASYWGEDSKSYWQVNNNNNSWWEGNTSTSYWGSTENSNPNIPEVKEPENKKYILKDKQWDIKEVTNNGESYIIETGNHNVVVGIVDSGVDTDHKDLKGNFLGGENCVPANYLDDESEKGDKNDIEDRYGHGTRVTGFIAANGEMTGVAPNIGYKSYRIFDSDGNTDFFLCADAVIKAVDDGVNVINLSLASFYLEGTHTYTDPDTLEVTDLGNNSDQYEVIKRAVDYALDHDVVVVTSSGNDYADCTDAGALAEYFNSIDYEGYTYIGNMYQIPGCFEGVINVSSTDFKDNLADYSNYGKGVIDIAAPGGSSEKYCWTTSNDGDYSYGGGTSYAAPKVTAAAALILCQNNSLKPKDVEKKLYESAKKIQIDDSERYFGAGIVNIYEALR